MSTHHPPTNAEAIARVLHHIDAHPGQLLTKDSQLDFLRTLTAEHAFHYHSDTYGRTKHDARSLYRVLMNIVRYHQREGEAVGIGGEAVNRLFEKGRGVLEEGYVREVMAGLTDGAKTGEEKREGEDSAIEEEGEDDVPLRFADDDSDDEDYVEGVVKQSRGELRRAARRKRLHRRRSSSASDASQRTGAETNPVSSMPDRTRSQHAAGTKAKVKREVSSSLSDVEMLSEEEAEIKRKRSVRLTIRGSKHENSPTPHQLSQRPCSLDPQANAMQRKTPPRPTVEVIDLDDYPTPPPPSRWSISLAPQEDETKGKTSTRSTSHAIEPGNISTSQPTERQTSPPTKSPAYAEIAEPSLSVSPQHQDFEQPCPSLRCLSADVPMQSVEFAGVFDTVDVEMRTSICLDDTMMLHRERPGVEVRGCSVERVVACAPPSQDAAEIRVEAAVASNGGDGCRDVQEAVVLNTALGDSGDLDSVVVQSGLALRSDSKVVLLDNDDENRQADPDAMVLDNDTNHHDESNVVTPNDKHGGASIQDAVIPKNDINTHAHPNIVVPDDNHAQTSTQDAVQPTNDEVHYDASDKGDGIDAGRARRSCSAAKRDTLHKSRSATPIREDDGKRKPRSYSPPVQRIEPRSKTPKIDEGPCTVTSPPSLFVRDLSGPVLDGSVGRVGSLVLPGVEMSGSHMPASASFVDGRKRTLDAMLGPGGGIESGSMNSLEAKRRRTTELVLPQGNLPQAADSKPASALEDETMQDVGFEPMVAQQLIQLPLPATESDRQPTTTVAETSPAQHHSIEQSQPAIPDSASIEQPVKRKQLIPRKATPRHHPPALTPRRWIPSTSCRSTPQPSTPQPSTPPPQPSPVQRQETGPPPSNAAPNDISGTTTTAAVATTTPPTPSIPSVLATLRKSITTALSPLFPAGHQPTATLFPTPPPALRSLYLETFQTRAWPSVASNLSLQSRLPAPEFLHSLIAAWLLAHIFRREVPWASPVAPGSEVRAMLQAYLGPELATRGVECGSVLREAAGRQLRDGKFVVGVVEPLARKLGAELGETLEGHLALLPLPPFTNGSNNVDSRAAFHTELVRICQLALLLRGRLEALEGDYFWLWYSPGKEFEGELMEGEERREGQDGVRRVAFTVFPGLLMPKGEEFDLASVVGRTVVAVL